MASRKKLERLQGLKPLLCWFADGTAEAVPYHCDFVPHEIEQKIIAQAKAAKETKVEEEA